ncbi:hypothetical protein CERZMDRAFT_93874 [Cercospora zeae-maydis SCOH1-5]|uniref:Uncharacterized protein n=1 Tax=Cercospora zeae-maydis SCOH1-5 TaxID=717836 RepID=A0A6A6FTG4_9PEZI|nr:hypothetical protein CERZMDRAFT_93874 [Cercospora zeae-maydis SCOH1-5]
MDHQALSVLQRMFLMFPASATVEGKQKVAEDNSTSDNDDDDEEEEEEGEEEEEEADDDNDEDEGFDNTAARPGKTATQYYGWL